METLDIITQAILSYAPSIVSIITMICTVIVSIKKVTSATSNSLKEVRVIKKDNEDIKVELAAVLNENAVLKEQLEKCLNRMNNVAEVDYGKER